MHNEAIKSAIVFEYEDYIGEEAATVLAAASFGPVSEHEAEVLADAIMKNIEKFGLEETPPHFEELYDLYIPRVGMGYLAAYDAYRDGYKAAAKLMHKVTRPLIGEYAHEIVAGMCPIRSLVRKSARDGYLHATSTVNQAVITTSDVSVYSAAVGDPDNDDYNAVAFFGLSFASLIPIAYDAQDWLSLPPNIALGTLDVHVQHDDLPLLHVYFHGGHGGVEYADEYSDVLEVLLGDDIPNGLALVKKGRNYYSAGLYNGKRASVKIAGILP